MSYYKFKVRWPQEAAESGSASCFCREEGLGTLETRHKVDTYHSRYSSPDISCADNTLEVPLLWCITVEGGYFDTPVGST